MSARNATPVIVAGGGIGGLAFALTCHQIGVPVIVLEAVAEVRPLGVGINLQPNAVRELQDLGLGEELAGLGVETRGYNMYSKLGGLIWAEPRGVEAGYRWPQYSVHRGGLQMMLYRAVVDRLGPDAVVPSSRVVRFDNDRPARRPDGNPDGADDGARVTVTVTDHSGSTRTIRGSVLIGADGIHSTVRAQMYPDEGEPLWNGRLLWRATTRAEPYLDGATMVLSGHDETKMVSYPITTADSGTGPESETATLNWIAMRTFDPESGFNKEDYTREARVEDFLSAYDGWSFPWIEDLEVLVRGAERIYEYPLVDRDPLPRWADGPTTLLGDAAHVMYPVGSNGASQAIVDARTLGRAFLDHGVGPDALEAYEALMRPATEKMILTNRSAGPDYIMEIVEQRCGGRFDDITDVMSYQELSDFADRYKQIAGFAITELNERPPIIPPDVTIND